MEQISKQGIKRLKRYKMKKYRDLDSRFLAEGRKLVLELLHSSCPVELIVVTQQWLDKNNTVDQFSVPTLLCDEKEFNQLSQLRQPDGILACCHQLVPKPYQKRGWTLVLDHLNNPGNLGTIIRTADWFGFNEIICDTNTVDVYNHKVIQSTMGSIVRISVHYTDIKAYLSTQNRPVFGATLQGQRLEETAFKESGIVLMGNESHGIDNALFPFIDQEITIPKIGQAESLNVAVATGIILSSIANKSLQIT